MALFTDEWPASIEDLRRYDARCEDLAKDAQVDLNDKLSASAEDVGQDILDFLLFQGVPDNHAWRQRRGLADVVVTPALRRWHAVRALAELYHDACGPDINDRYRNKWKELEGLARVSAEKAFAAGIGLAQTPVPRAPLATVAETGPANLRASRTVRITWVAADGTEGAPGPEWRTDLAPGDVVCAPGGAPEVAKGWNVYIGIGGGTPLLQNDRPLPLGESWRVPQELNAGRPVGAGQWPDYYVVERRILPRG